MSEGICHGCEEKIWFGACWLWAMNGVSLRMHRRCKLAYIQGTTD